MAAGVPHDAPEGPSGTGPVPGPPPAGPGPASGWTAGRITAVVAGSFLAVISFCLLAGAATMVWADQAQRHDGFLTTGTARYSASGYALASERLELGWGWLLTGLIGDVRIQVTGVSPARPVFVAIGPADRVSAYLSGAAYSTVTRSGGGGLVAHYGPAAPAPPRTAGIWTAQASGTGPQTLRWTPKAGDWMMVAMNRDGSAGLAVRADAGISAPWLLQVAISLILGGLLLGVPATALIVVPVRMASGAR